VGYNGCYKMREFRPDPKPIKKEKVTDKNYWSKIRLKSAKKKGIAKQDTNTLDEIFYNEIWQSKPHICIECRKELTVSCETDDSDFTFQIRFYMHHILCKRKYSQFRHDERNIAMLCYTCHGKAESAISYPKMNCYNQLEDIKKQLLNFA
jgi:hypothetical protein